MRPVDSGGDVTAQEFAIVTEFVQKHHKFALYLDDAEASARKLSFPKLDRFGFNIKYIDSVYDSRDAKFWQVSFRGAVSSSFRDSETPKPFTHFEWVMAYLRGEWVSKKSKRKAES